MKTSPLPIDQRHKQMLRSTLMKAHPAVVRSVDPKNFSMKQFFRWSLVPALAVTGFAAVLTLLPKTLPQSGLAGVRAALAAEMQQAAQHLVHHQKIQVQVSGGTQPNISTTEEYWIRDDARATLSTTSAGIVNDRSLTTYAADGSVEKRYALYPSTIAFSEDEESNVRCVLSVADVNASSGAAGAQEKADSLITIDRIADRQALIEILLKDPNVSDLGERDGKHVFSIAFVDEDTLPAETTLYEYAFDPSTFSLSEYSIHYFSGTAQEYTYTYTYLVNEYLEADQVAESTWSTNGLTEISDELQQLAGKDSGCYDVSGAKVADLKFTKEKMSNGNLQVVIDAAENPYVEHIVFSADGNNQGVSSVVIINGNPS
ncbi:MAG: hypothetical protein KIH62_005305 [Candidatus Kerfeldbacteria bacterium]|nr:hypothetical protein [Candidatus Kerfeldbacteria bacterium]